MLKSVKPARSYSSAKTYPPDQPESVVAKSSSSAKKKRPAKTDQVKQADKAVVKKPIVSAANTSKSAAPGTVNNGHVSIPSKSLKHQGTTNDQQSQMVNEPVASSEVLKEKQADASTTVKPAEAAGNSDQDKPLTQSGLPGETQLALAEPALTADDESSADRVAASELPKINLSIDMLPHRFGSWTLEHNWDNQHPHKCRLRSEKTAVNDGYDNTWLWAEILPDEINIYTGSNIDLEYEGSGLQFGSNPVQSFTGFLTETSVNMAGDHRRSLRNAESLTVYLGFWPTWPKTDIRRVVLPAQELVQALPVFDACQTWSE